VRVAVVDIGTNSTRLLVCDVEDGAISEFDRRSQVTRLGTGVDASGRLAEESMQRVFATLDVYREAIDAAGCDVVAGVLTSAVRDASNWAEFAEEVRSRYGIDAATIDGDTEAQLTFVGATSTRPPGAPEPLLVIDIGGGSTEFVEGATGHADFHVSTQAGVVRQTERHLHSDPPEPDELQALSADVREVFAGALPPDVRSSAQAAVAVAGTATSSAAIQLALEPYDPARVEGHVLELGELELTLARLAAMPLEKRREVPGLHPDRAPTIVAGVAILIEALRAFGLEQVSVSEHDILYGVALTRAGRGH
jgi:exopolyphosphatase/guanosine-5'-triphosphate,3'-diphosphate pyrophosphatase